MVRPMSAGPARMPGTSAMPLTEEQVVKRLQDSRLGPVLLPPGLAAAPVLDLMCTHFVLALASQLLDRRT